MDATSQILVVTPSGYQHENEMSNPESLNFKGIFKKMPSAFQTQNSSRQRFLLLQHQQSKILDCSACNLQWPPCQHFLVLLSWFLLYKLYYSRNHLLSSQQFQINFKCHQKIPGINLPFTKTLTFESNFSLAMLKLPFSSLSIPLRLLQWPTCYTNLWANHLITSFVSMVYSK